MNDGPFGARRIADPRAVVAEWRAKAEAHGWSLRETVIALGPQRGHVGTPSGLADKFAHFVRHGAIDGFNVTPYLIPGGLDDIVDLLVPELRERGIYRTEYTGTTLSEHLGLREPPHPPVRAGPTAGGLSTGMAFHSGLSTHD
ncbi:hypothetical protein N8I84_02505 [Streptomyces cynarae]|uniref:Uncharacterized protein n=1 Tax=Streptomyces cynarae TaxID=2981134 RepID=A0ABY6DUN6_9ACTN|nr:hypothetical protein [Streptomyces cynarae]UXY17732.1 hypothetical protein N8I84_02505 [Streptomyces cynarae]